MKQNVQRHRASRVRDFRQLGARLRRKRHGGPRRVPWVLAVPALAFLFAFHYIPAFAGGLYALTDWNGLSAHAHFVGLGNFRQIFRDPTARGAILHTLELAGAFVVLVNVL